MAGLMCFLEGIVETPPKSNAPLRAEFCTVHLLTFTIISQCCSPGMRVALKSCRSYLDAGHQAWQFITSTYQVTRWPVHRPAGGENDAPTNGRAGDNNRRLQPGLATSRHHADGQRAVLDGVLHHACPKGAPEQLQPDEAAFVGAGHAGIAERGLADLVHPQGRGDAGGQAQKLAMDSGHGEGGRCRECWQCHSPDHLSFKCPDRRLPGGGSSCAGKPGGGPARQLLLAPPDGTKDAFVDLELIGDAKHVHSFNGALQDVRGRGTVALQREAGKQVLILDVLYIPGMQANLLSANQLKENGAKLQDNGDAMLLVSTAEDVLGWATYTGRILYTDLHPYSTKFTTPTTEPSAGTDSPFVSRVGGKLEWHTFPDKGSDADGDLAVMHIDLCGPFQVAAKDGNLYFPLLKDRKTSYVWVRQVAKKSDVLREFARWLVVVERQPKKSVLMLHSDQAGEFLGKEFTAFVDCNGIIHDFTCMYTLQQNGMAEREMRMVLES
ncbi:unnamed protein product, partial [Closterium sp. NIES-53]